MRILAVDTSTQFTFLALCAFSDIWNVEKSICVKIDREKDNWLELLIGEFCGSFPLNRLDGFAAGYGPGSFTGLRINFTYLKALAILWDKIFLTFSTSRFYHSIFCKPGEILLVQANRNLYFSCDPDQPDKIDNIRPLSDWEKHYSKPQVNAVAPKKILLWNQYPRAANAEPLEFPEIDPQSSIQGVISKTLVDLPDPDYILKNKKELMRSLPFYGHDVVINRKL